MLTLLVPITRDNIETCTNIVWCKKSFDLAKLSLIGHINGGTDKINATAETINSCIHKMFLY